MPPYNLVAFELISIKWRISQLPTEVNAKLIQHGSSKLVITAMPFSNYHG